MLPVDEPSADESHESPSPTGETIPAGVGVRIVCAAIDAGVPLAAGGLVIVAGAATGIAGLGWIVAPLVMLALGIWNLAFAALTGASYGRAAMGTRVVTGDPDAPAPGFSRVWVRALVASLTGGLACFGVLGDARRRGWHDRAAGVEVIDILNGPNPFGERPAAPVLRRARRGLVDVSSPISRPLPVVDPVDQPATT
ncbi:RDD family protein [uncultured Williamsia sp.]|uniref:RDD family protein n=1 Tax=uncultured Williamsia sp. TaxID=259311 RepID=UPI00262DEAB8|nr:RDD family protein [uncultured Williamsia sp.]